MTVQNKESAAAIKKELEKRVAKLLKAIETRELKSPSEGCPRGFWTHPDKMCVYESTKLERQLAVDDFKVILAQIKKI